jgi:hypothetical protein
VGSEIVCGTRHRKPTPGRCENGRLAAEAEKNVKLKQDKKSPESINCQAGFANIHKAASVRRK